MKFTDRHNYDYTGDRHLGTSIETCGRCGVVRKQIPSNSARITRTSARFSFGYEWAYSADCGETWSPDRIPCSPARKEGA